MIIKDDSVPYIDAIRSWVKDNGAVRVHLPEIYENGSVRLDFGFDRPVAFSDNACADIETYMSGDVNAQVFVMGFDLDGSDNVVVYFIRKDDNNQRWYKTITDKDDVLSYCVNAILRGCRCDKFPDAEFVSSSR